MFVETTRLIIVFLATAGGFTLAQQSPGDHAILGATLGAALGYVAGGILGRLLGQAMGMAERRIEQASPARLLAGTFGAVGAGGLALLVGFPLIVLLPPMIGWPALMLLVWIGVYAGAALAGHNAEGLLAMAGLSTRPLVRASPYGEAVEDGATLLDTSAVIDGRLLALARAGFLKGAVLVPHFVLDELQAIADAQDPVRRRRGRRGLDLLDALQRTPGVEVHIVDDEVLEHEQVDAKLVALARRLQVQLLTVDSPLQRVAEPKGREATSVWAVVVAAGSGERFGGAKQFAPLGGRRVLDWSVAAAADACDGVVLVLPPGTGEAPDPSDPPRPTGHTAAPTTTVTGGATRSASVRAGLARVPHDADVVVVHDAARPLAQPALFEAVIAAVRSGADGAVPGVRPADTIKRAAGSAVVDTLDRSQLVAVQTPQAFLASARTGAERGEPEST